MREAAEPLPVARRPPRAIVFDAGNTLLRMDYPAIAAYLGERGLRVTEADVEDAELRARVRIDPHLGPTASTESQGTHGLYVRYLLEHLGITGESDIEAITRWRFAYNRPVGLWHLAAPDAAAALRRVKAAGLAAGVISNSNGQIRNILEATGLAQDVDVIIDSAVVGVEKPDPRIFALALAELRVPAAEAVYVGDLYSVDVLGARAAGLDAVLLDPRGYWGPRDCPRATGIANAVRLALGA